MGCREVARGPSALENLLLFVRNLLLFCEAWETLLPTRLIQLEALEHSQKMASVWGRRGLRHLPGVVTSLWNEESGLTCSGNRWSPALAGVRMEFSHGEFCLPLQHWARPLVRSPLVLFGSVTACCSWTLPLAGSLADFTQIRLNHLDTLQHFLFSITADTFFVKVFFCSLLTLSPSLYWTLRNEKAFIHIVCDLLGDIFPDQITY